MKTPRDVSGDELIKKLRKHGYQFVRQNGSHVTIRTHMQGEHQVTIPLHSPLKIGTLTGILSDVAVHLKISRDELINDLF
jgi:predicted RNA binding protein YcfA (HicA-like mRNA interferase family)